MPITSGVWTNWTTPVANTSNASQASNTLAIWLGSTQANFSWFWSFILIMFYVALVILLSQEQGRKKFIAITFIGMIASFLMVSVSLISSGVVDASIGIWIITTILVLAFGG